jgi:hypothetical protein
MKRRRSDCESEDQKEGILVFTYILVHVMHEQEKCVIEEKIEHVWNIC